MSDTSSMFYQTGSEARRMAMLGGPSSAYLDVSMDRLRNFIPPPYLHPSKITPPGLSLPRGNGLLSPLPSRPSRPVPVSPGSDVITISSPRRTSSDFRPVTTKDTSMKSSTSSMPSSKSPSSSISSTSSSSSQSSSSLMSFSSFPPGPLFPGLNLNSVTSAIALKMGMFNATQQSVGNIPNIPEDVLKQSPKTPGSLSSPHQYLYTPFGPRGPSSSSSAPPSSSSSSPSSSSELPTSPLLSYPRFFTSFLSQEEQQQYIAMANLQAAAKDSQGFKNAPFASRNYLELAMLVCNTFRGKLFPCPHCRYVTDRRNNLKRHVATMHQACDKQLECCGVTFATKASLREHIAIFHHNGYSCAFCGRRFCRKALLKRHLSVHNGQKDYTCPHCDYATSHKSNLERHKRIHARLPENGESLVFPDTSIDDVIDESDIKSNNLTKITSSSSSGIDSATMNLPYYYERLRKSFTQADGTAFPNVKNDTPMGIPLQKSFLHHPYYLGDRSGRSTAFPSNHVTDLIMTTMTSTEEENSDSDIDIDSLDDNDNEIRDKPDGDKNKSITKMISPRPLEQSSDDIHPLNLVKVRHESD